MKKLLLYAPDVIGHPRVYCRVIADALADSPCVLVIAMGFGSGATLEDCPDLLPLVRRSGVQLLDTRDYSHCGAGHLTAEELVGLQERLDIETTLFIEADKSNAEFVRIASKASPPLRGRNLGIFAKTAEWYPGEDSFTGERLRLIAPTARTTLGNIKRAVFHRRKSLRHFFEKIIIGQKVLDEIFVKDERLARWHGPPVFWMPEISRPVSPAQTHEEVTEFQHRKAELENFREVNSGKEPVLYFGDAAFYKGYDLFLEFLAAMPCACGIHAGTSYDDQQKSYFRSDVEDLRRRLHHEGRLYETNSYVHFASLKRLFFDQIRLYLTTHRLALSSSTVIQALELGKPVLVPDRGLLGYRVNANNLGGVYRYGELDDLKAKAEKLWNSDLTVFAEPAKKFWTHFSDQAIKIFFLNRIFS